jgi:8-oxo-dGTP pyrophosphatase MutT (NUDIX family)
MRLLNKCNRNFEDLGGKTDVGDKTPLDTAIREACEETNNHIISNRHTFQECANFLFDPATDSMDVQYNEQSKYLLFRIRVHPSILDMDMRRFGRTEKTGVLNHYFQWRWSLPLDLHPRLRRLEL